MLSCTISPYFPLKIFFMAPRTSPDQAARDAFARGSTAFAAAATLLALSTGPFESRPDFPLNAAQVAELAAIHNAVPGASRTDGLTALKDERVDFFSRIGAVCTNDEGGRVPPTDLSSWTHRDIPTGNGDGTFDRGLTRYTAFECGDSRWELKGEGANLAFVTPRGFSRLDSWTVPVDLSEVSVAKIAPTEVK